MNGGRCGTDAAALDALGAAMGSLGLVAFAGVCWWLIPRSADYQRMLQQAVRCPDPFVRLSGQWLVRQLAPDSSPIEIETMNGQKDQDKLLHAMAWETANVHFGTAGAAGRIVADLNRRYAKWLRKAVKDMGTAVSGDWLVWKPTLNEVTRHEPHKGDKRQIRREQALLKSRWKSLAADRLSDSKTMSWASGMSSSNS